MDRSLNVRLAVCASHTIQYQAPLFRELARKLDLAVMFGHNPSPADQAAAGFGVHFSWDVDLLAGYPNSFLKNVSSQPGVSRFNGCDTPEVGRIVRRGSFDALLLMGW